MDMQKSALAKWALSRRLEAHALMPGLFSLALIALYFFTPRSIQALVFPGTVEIPLAGGQTLGLAHLVIAMLLVWILVLALSILRISRSGMVWLAVVLVCTGVVMAVMTWLDGHSLASRAAGLLALSGQEQGPVYRFLAERADLLNIGVVCGFSLLFFVVFPLIFGDPRGTEAAALVPSRWLALTTLVMCAVFWLAFRLQRLGLASYEGTEAPRTDEPLLFLGLPVFCYLWVLFMARIQFRLWVRHEGAGWRPTYRS
jgi:hypothetical protein